MTQMTDRTFLRRSRAEGFDVSLCDPTGIPCPREECQLIVVYNGNYFCACGWACPPDGPRLTAEQKAFINLLYNGLMEYRAKRRMK